MSTTPTTPNRPEGFIQAVKRAVVLALRDAFSTTNLELDDPDGTVLHDISDNIDMEYPKDIVNYPGIWVQFSFNKLQKAGVDPYLSQQIGDTRYDKKVWWFEGRVTLNIVALSSKHRDRISDALIEVFAFDTKTSKRFWDKMGSYPEIYFSVNKDTLAPGGQSVNVGAPWQADQLVYEDSYTFELIGQFMSEWNGIDGVRLTRIDVVPILAEDQTEPIGRTREGIRPPEGAIPPGHWF